MALQGTLDTFELPDVLRLLSSTRKSGRLHLQSDRGEGDVWIADGAVVGADAVGAPAGDLAAALFELLRSHEGSFVFQPGEAPATPGVPSDVEPLLAGAEEQLAEWREIESVVPSLDSWVCLATELPEPTVTVDAATWRLVATIGSGLTVHDLGRVLDLGEVAVSRLVRDLVVLGLGAVTAAPPVLPSRRPDVVEPAAALAPVEEPAPMFAVAEPASYADLAPVDEAPAPVAAAEPASFLAPSPFEVPVPTDDDEVARQLALLSPRAAEAVAAAAAADDDEARDAALQAFDEDGEEPINRGLLLKFLGSVKT